jgi:ribosome maturation factor RimP
MKDNFLIDKLTELIEPIATSLGYELYHIEYIKEQGEYYLRIYIDKPEGISLEDCEKVSRKTSDLLDETDPISDSYYLEVSSPGIERMLYNNKHLKKYINSNIVVKLSKLFNGSKKYEGKLLSFDDNIITIEYENSNISIPRDIVNKIILKGEF